MKKITFTFLGLLTILSAFGQLQPVDVSELTLKVGAMGSEELFYGFAEGDQIVFNFEELKEKELKELEIIELPSNSKFMDYKTAKIENKKISVTQKAVYQFKFNNSAISSRICKVKIQRIPKTEDLIAFNTNWEWKTLYDTTYVPYTEDSIVGYNKIQIPYTQKELIKVDTNYVNKELKPRVHTKLNPDGDKVYVSFDLPINIKTELLTKEIVSWAYYIGTDDKEPVISNYANEAAKVVSVANPVAGLALGAVSLATSTAGNNINYYLVKDYQNVQLFLAGSQFYMIEKGDASIASNRFIDRLMQGTVYLCLDNDHTYPVDVLIKFSAVVINKTYENKQYTREEQKPIYVTLNKKRMVVNTSKIRVNSK